MYFNDEQEIILDTPIKCFPGGLKDGYEPDHYENLPPYYFPKEKTINLRDLPNQMPRLDQLPAFQNQLYQMPEDIKQKLLGNEFERGLFLYYYALAFSAKIQCRL